MKLVGFSLWRSAEGEVYVTFPSRAFGASNDRRYFEFLRSAELTMVVRALGYEITDTAKGPRVDGA